MPEGLEIVVDGETGIPRLIRAAVRLLGGCGAAPACPVEPDIIFVFYGLHYIVVHKLRLSVADDERHFLTSPAMVTEPVQAVGPQVFIVQVIVFAVLVRKRLPAVLPYHKLVVFVRLDDIIGIFGGHTHPGEDLRGVELEYDPFFARRGLHIAVVFRIFQLSGIFR